MDWKAIMNQLPEELQYEVTTFIPSKTMKITDAFVKWYKDEYPDEEFLGIKMDPIYSSNPNPEEENLHIHMKRKETDFRGGYWIVGKMDTMRRAWNYHNEGRYLYYEEEGQYANPDWVYQDVTWDEWICGSFFVDETIFYVVTYGVAGHDSDAGHDNVQKRKCCCIS